VRAHRELLARHLVVLVDGRSVEQREPRDLEIVGAYFGKPLRDATVEQHVDDAEIATGLRQLVQAVRRGFHLFVLEQPPHELGARVVFNVGL
jgi:hypothetical protein